MASQATHQAQREQLQRARRADDHLRSELMQDEPEMSNEWLQEFDGRLGKKLRGNDE
jgi:hypothetical protein